MSIFIVFNSQSPIVRQLCASCVLARLRGAARWLPPRGRNPDAAGQPVHQDVHRLTTMRRYPKLKYHTFLEDQGLQPAHAPQGSSSSLHSRCPRCTRTTGVRTFGKIFSNISVNNSHSAKRHRTFGNNAESLLESGRVRDVNKLPNRMPTNYRTISLQTTEQNAHKLPKRLESITVMS